MKLRGLRGSAFEDMINRTIEEYRQKKLALIQKIPTPIVPTKMDKEGHITLGYFDKKSTVDYIGVVQEIPVCFDAKECASNTFPLANIHKHQFDFMKEFEEQALKCGFAAVKRCNYAGLDFCFKFQKARE